MTVSTTIGYQRTSGDGVTTVFAVPFALVEAAQLIVELVHKTTGVVTPQTLDTHYTLAIAADFQSASVTFVTAPPSTHWAVRRRQATYTQPTHIIAHGRFPADVVELAIDRLAMDLQALRDTVQRGVRLSDSDPVFAATLPPLSTILGKYLFINGAGEPIGVDGPAGVAISAAMTPVVQGGTLAAALTAFGFSSYFQTLIGATQSLFGMSPGGRLTLSAGVPVLNGDVTAATVLRYTPYVHASVPIYDGSAMASTPFAELTNDLTQSATGKAGPAAAGPYQVIDGFVWNDSGTVRLTRGPKFRKAGTFTISVATPAVVTWAGHGLHTGATWTPEATTGNLPTGAQVVVGTTYFVTKVDADTFKLSTTLANLIAGTFIATSGTQSGVHTGANYTVDRGTGAGTSELEMVDGILVNKFDITNGPAAQRGTWVGTIYCNSSSQVDFKKGSAASGFGEAIIGIWNAYNRVDLAGAVINSGSWSNTAAWRPAGGLAAARATVVSGLREDDISGTFGIAVYSGGSSANVGMSVGFNSISTSQAEVLGSPGSHGYGSPSGSGVGTPFGLAYLCALENFGSGAGYSTGGNAGLVYRWRY